MYVHGLGDAQERMTDDEQYVCECCGHEASLMDIKSNPYSGWMTAIIVCDNDECGMFDRDQEADYLG